MIWTTAQVISLFLSFFYLDTMECIIHCQIKNQNYSKLKMLSDTNKERIFKAKSIREQYDDNNYRAYQCKSIPSSFNDKRDSTHLEPCYKCPVRFSFIYRKWLCNIIFPQGKNIYWKFFEKHPTFLHRFSLLRRSLILSNDLKTNRGVCLLFVR